MKSAVAAAPAAGLLILLWSLSWVVMKGAQAWCGPLLFGALSCAVGFLPTLPKMFRHGWPGGLPLCLVGAVGVGAFQALGQLALSMAGPGQTVVLIYSMPFWATLLAWPWLGEHPSTPRKWGLLLAAAGVLCVIAPWRGVNITGALLALASGVCWAIGAVATRAFLRRRPDYPVFALTGWQLLAGCLVLFPLAIAHRETITGLSAGLLGGLAYSGLLCGAVAWALWATVVRRLPIAGAGVVTLLVPPAGVFFAWLFLREVPSLHESLGLALILAGFAVSLLPSPGATPVAASPLPEGSPGNGLA